MQKQEVWKTVEGFNGDYKISNFGNLIMFYQGCWQPKSSYITNAGYLQTVLQRNKIKRRVGIHQLVAEAFVDGWFEGAEVNHKDLDKTNNRWDNLEWVTHQENQKHQYRAYHPNHVDTVCKKCGTPLNNNKSEYCVKCYAELRRENWPLKEELEQDLLYMNYTTIGHKYGKTDNWVRKVCKYYGLPASRKELIEFQKEHGAYVPSKNSLKLSNVHYDIKWHLKKW